MSSSIKNENKMMGIVIPYDCYEDETKRLTPRELRTYMLTYRMRTRMYEGKEIAFVTIAGLETMLKYSSNETRSRDRVAEDVESIKKKGFMNYESQYEEDKKNKKRHHELLQITFNQTKKYHTLDFKHFDNISDHDELMILAYIEKWKGAKFPHLITEEDFCKVLGYTSRNTIEDRLKKMIKSGVIKKGVKMWNVEKGYWNPNKYNVVDPNEVEPIDDEEEQGKNEENLIDEEDKGTDSDNTHDEDQDEYEWLKENTNFFKQWKDENKNPLHPLTWKCFYTMLRYDNEKFTDDVRKKLDGIGSKNNGMQEMFERLEKEAVEKLRAERLAYEIQEAQIARTLREMNEVYTPEFKEKMERIEEERQQENAERVDPSTILDETEEEVVYTTEEVKEEQQYGLSQEEFASTLASKNVKKDPCMEWLDKAESGLPW